MRLRTGFAGMRDVAFAVARSEFVEHSPLDFGFVRVGCHDTSRTVPRLQLKVDLHHPRAVDLYDARTRRDHPAFIAGAVFDADDPDWRSAAVNQHALPIFVADDLAAFRSGHAVSLLAALFGVASLHYDRRAMWAGQPVTR